MTEMSDDEVKGCATGGLLGIVVALLGGTIYIHGCINKVPNTDKVQSGYVAPSKLEVKLGDLDGDGEVETIVKIDGKQYLLKQDAKGKPQLFAYEIKPVEGNAGG